MKFELELVKTYHKWGKLGYINLELLSRNSVMCCLFQWGGVRWNRGDFCLLFVLSLWLLSDCLYNLNKSCKILGYLHHIQVLCSQICLHFFSYIDCILLLVVGGFKLKLNPTSEAWITPNSIIVINSSSVCICLKKGVI